MGDRERWYSAARGDARAVAAASSLRVRLGRFWGWGPEVGALQTLADGDGDLGGEVARVALDKRLKLLAQQFVKPQLQGLLLVPVFLGFLCHAQHCNCPPRPL